MAPASVRLLRAAAARALDLPPTRWARTAWYERAFRLRPGAFRGVYASFAEAARAVPPGALEGYDHAPLAGLYRDRLEQLHASDYPVLYWLSRLLPGAPSVLDFGGHVGIAFHSYRRYLQYPPDLRWSVVDVPAVIEEGARLARERGATGLAFFPRLSAAGSHEIFLAAGSLQYVERPLAALLGDLGELPRHVILSKLPLARGAPFVTLQNTLHSYNPYRVESRTAFVASLERLGYRVVDEWDNPDQRLTLPLDEERSLEAYTGMYLALDGAGRGSPEGPAQRAIR